MKAIAITLLAFAALAVTTPSERAQACGSLGVYNTVAEYVQGLNPGGGSHIRDNGNGTVTLNPGTSHERTYTPQLGQGDCPSGGTNPVTPLTVDESGTRLCDEEGANCRAPSTLTDYRAPVQSPSRQSNARRNVQAEEGEPAFTMRVSQFIDGDYDTLTLTSDDEDVVTVREGSCGITGHGGGVTHVPCISITPQGIDADATPRQVFHCTDPGQGVPADDSQRPSNSRLPSNVFVGGNPATCSGPYYSATPEYTADPAVTTEELESEEATVTVTATNSETGRSVTVTFTVTVFVDPNEDG